MIFQSVTSLFFLAAVVHGITFSIPDNYRRRYPYRPRRSLATICVEIKPGGPQEGPYYMCKGTDFANVPKVSHESSSKYTFSQTSQNEVAQPSSSIGFTEAERHRNAGFEQNDANLQRSLNKPDNDVLQATHEQFGQTTTNTGSERSGDRLFPGFLNKLIGKTETIHNYAANGENPTKYQTTTTTTHIKHPTTSNYQTTETFHQNHNQQKYLQQQQQLLQQHIQQQQQQQKYQHQQQPQKHEQQYAQQFFRPMPDSTTVNGQLNEYESVYTNEQSNRPKSGSSFATKHTSSVGGSGCKKYHSGSGIYQGQGTDTSQSDDNTECNPESTKSGSSFSHNRGAASIGQYQTTTKSAHAGNSYAHESNPITTSTANDDIGSISQSISRTSTATSRSSSLPTTARMATNRHTTTGTSREFSRLAPPLLMSSNPMHGGDFQNRHQHSEFRHSGNENFQMPSQVQRNNPESLISMQNPMAMMEPAERYRSTIDDEVLNMPNWGFSPEELDLYRSMPEEDAIMNSFGPKPSNEPSIPMDMQARSFPQEHLDDPVMRNFYSSMIEKNVVSSAAPPQPEMKPEASPKQFSSPRTASQETPSYPPNMPSAVPCPTQQCYPGPTSTAPATYYTPCGSGQRECNYQPVFITLPCFGQPMNGNLLQSTNTPYGGSVTWPLIYSNGPISGTDTKQSSYRSNSANDPDTSMPLIRSNNEMMPQLHNTRMPTTTKTVTNTETHSWDIISSSHPSTISIGNNDEIGKKKTSTTTSIETSTKKSFFNEDKDSEEEKLDGKEEMPSKTTVTSKNSEENSSSSVSAEEQDEKIQLTEKNQPIKNVTKITTKTETIVNKTSKTAISSTATTPSSIIEASTQEGEARSQTTFKSLINAARKLAQMVGNDGDPTTIDVEISTPKSTIKKTRQIAGLNDTNKKRKYVQQL